MSILQQYLRDGGLISDLLTRYAIKSTRHKQYNNLVLFKYNQIESPFAEPIVRESRGVILDEDNNWRFVSRPFDKFFNHGEQLAAEIDWSTARVQEKLDGSLACLYHYDGVWHVQTSGTPDASGEVNGMGLHFRELFWQVFGEMKVPLPTNDNYTYMFELMTPYNRVVVQHRDRRLALIGIRHRETGQEYLVGDMLNVYPTVRSFPLQSMADVQATLADMKPLEQEGYVIVDHKFNRVKVKSPAYVAIHHMRDGFGPRRLVEVVRTGETAELLAHFPEWKPDFDKMQVKFDALVAEIEADYEKLKHIETQKDFAIQAVKTKCSSALFMIRKGQAASVREFLAKNLTIYRVMDLLGVDTREPVGE